jgi:hypothetical protein
MLVGTGRDEDVRELCFNPLRRSRACCLRAALLSRDCACEAEPADDAGRFGKVERDEDNPEDEGLVSREVADVESEIMLNRWCVMKIEMWMSAHATKDKMKMNIIIGDNIYSIKRICNPLRNWGPKTRFPQRAS